MKLYVSGTITLLFLISGIRGAFDGATDWSASRGRATSAISEGAASFWANPSGILSGGKWNSVAILKREWGLAELATGKTAVVLPTKWGTFAAGGSFTGDPALFTETIIGVAYARELGRFGIGGRINLAMAKSEEWSASTVIIGFGGFVPAGNILTFGAWADNITASKLDGNELPVKAAVGALLEPTDWVGLTADVYLEGDYPATLRFGQEISLARIFFIRSGVNFRPNCFHLGLGTRYRGFELSWAYIGHPELGGSTLLGLTYEGIE
ncbi:hypothetical protein DRQ36_06985 [bacterium]|nr:MAG: hypothetical protein DRQ36_06985 [bacterium]